MTCCGLTQSKLRCKKSSKYWVECYGVSLGVCSQHRHTNPIYLWSYNIRSNEKVPEKIKKFLDFYNDITFYYQDMNKWLAVLVTSELFETESSKLSRRRLLGKFYEKVFLETNKGDCPICLDTNCEMISTRCGHAFCRDCIISWVNKKPSCPLCRNILLTYSK